MCYRESDDVVGHKELDSHIRSGVSRWVVLITYGHNHLVLQYCVAGKMLDIVIVASAFGSCFLLVVIFLLSTTLCTCIYTHTLHAPPIVFTIKCGLPT